MLLKLVFSLLLHWIYLHCFLRRDQDIFSAVVLHKYTKQKQSFQAHDNGDVLQYRLNQLGLRCSLVTPINKNYASMLNHIILNKLGVDISRSAHFCYYLECISTINNSSIFQSTNHIVLNKPEVNTSRSHCLYTII